MKCENCGKNEVTFVYQSNINGETEEKHLCAECAEKLGYTRKLAAQSQRMMRGFRSFFDDGFFGGGLLENFWNPAGALSGETGGFFGEDLLDGFFDQMPALGAGETEDARQSRPEETELPISDTEQSRFARARRLNQLRLELKRAVHQERFEDAAKLRDELHALEAEPQE